MLYAACIRRPLNLTINLLFLYVNHNSTGLPIMTTRTRKYDKPSRLIWPRLVWHLEMKTNITVTTYIKNNMYANSMHANSTKVVGDSVSWFIHREWWRRCRYLLGILKTILAFTLDNFWRQSMIRMFTSIREMQRPKPLVKPLVRRYILHFMHLIKVNFIKNVHLRKALERWFNAISKFPFCSLEPFSFFIELKQKL